MSKASKFLVIAFLVIFVPVSLVVTFSLVQAGFKPYVRTGKSFCGVCLALKYEKEYSLLGCSWSENIYEQTVVSDYLTSEFPKIYDQHLHQWSYISRVGSRQSHILGQASEICAIGTYYYVWGRINSDQDWILQAFKHMAKQDRAIIPYLAVLLGKEDLLQKNTISYLPVDKKIVARINKALRSPYCYVLSLRPFKIKK
ncbi:hypothetical protein [Candidatus Uabimicrobium sp. HlEnr_7]|uniref:hypothetical protein n=1 Tax=Candidatus Uabimicrobium helgolandensis TaxID=3095367 RepID=UPI003555DD47